MPLGRGHFHHYDIGLLLLLLGIVKGNLVFLQIKIINFFKKMIGIYKTSVIYCDTLKGACG
jgi:hypothetical protein